jgi:hypothetical protein
MPVARKQTHKKTYFHGNAYTKNIGSDDFYLVRLELYSACFSFVAYPNHMHIQNCKKKKKKRKKKKEKEKRKENTTAKSRD